MVENMSRNDTVHEVCADQAQVTIDRCSGATLEVPGAVFVVRQARIGVLKVRDSNCTMC